MARYKDDQSVIDMFKELSTFELPQASVDRDLGQIRSMLIQDQTRMLDRRARPLPVSRSRDKRAERGVDKGGSRVLPMERGAAKPVALVQNTRGLAPWLKAWEPIPGSR